ncbi:alpha/beta hydrolase [Kineococcus sp. SYSU DK018]|uniref:alpha/beta hydrolase n=1 Tax=Kineococcus sp. SYSU DK018 TaxID=3383139 RepID=UPI003D7D15DF
MTTPGTAPRVLLVTAPGVLPCPRTAREVLEGAAAARGARARLVTTGSAAEFHDAVAEAAAGGEFLLMPAGPAAVDTSGLPLQGARVLRVDLDERGPDTSVAVRRHLRGRGLDGIRYAVDAWHFHRTSPAVQHPYGEHADQRAELRLPPGEGPFPVAVLVHGGYWRSRWENDLMEAMAADLTGRGFATWNVEYRRPDAHGWNATTADVAAALQALAGVGGPLDLSRVVTLGHSAGGQLVGRLAADCGADPLLAVRPALTVSLAGCLDLVTTDRRWIGEGAAALALGGRAGDRPEVYAASSPLARLPVGLPIAVVCGRQDSLDLLDISRAFAAAAAAAGDDVLVLEDEGDHFSVIDPRSGIWPGIVDLVLSRVRP